MNFSEEWDKLKNLKAGTIITTIRWNDYPQQTGDHIPINLKGKLIARAIVVGVEHTVLGKISSKLIEFDTKSNYNCLIFYNLIKKFYSQKSNWQELQSKVKIYFLLITEVIQ